MKQRRVKFTQKLPDTPDTYETFAITNYWRQHRTAAANLVRAIKLFAALQRGDTSLLFEFFPLLRGTLSAARPVAAAPALPAFDVQITTVAKSEADNLSDLFSEFGEVEF